MEGFPLPMKLIFFEYSNIFDFPALVRFGGEMQHTTSCYLSNNQPYFSWSNHHHYPHTTTIMMAPSDIRITTDKKFEQAKQIYAIAEQWHDAIVALQELCCAIGDRTSSRNSLLEKSSFVKKLVIPLMSDSIVNITAAAKVLSPVPGIEYVHRRKECKWKQEILFSKSSTLSPGEELIVQYVKDSQHKNNQENIRTPPTKRQCIIHACISPTENSDAIELPNPESGEAYTKGEIVNILSNRKPHGHHHSQVM